MKAKIIEEVIYEGTMDWVHGGGQMVRRLLIEEKNDLCITFFQDQLLAFTGYDLDKHLRNVPSQDDEFGIEQKLAIVLGEVEVPDDLVEAAFAFANAGKKLVEFIPKFKSLSKLS